MESIQKLIKDYLDYLEIEKNRSPLTRRSYERCLRKFAELSKPETQSIDAADPKNIADAILQLFQIGKL